MKIEYNNVSSKIKELISQDKIILLPMNWETLDKKNYLFSENTQTVKKLLLSNDLPIEIFGLSQDSKIINNRHIEWVAPIIFLSASFVSNNPHATSIALSIVANYLTEIFKGFSSEPDVTIKLYTENKNGEVKEALYKGPVSGLEEFQKSIKEFTKLK